MRLAAGHLGRNLRSVKAMKKKLIIGIFAAAVLLYVTVDLLLGSIVTRGVDRFGPQLTQTPVELIGAHLSPLSGSGTLYGLSVGNPKGWSSEKAFHLGQIHVSVEPTSIFSDRIVVDEIVIDQPEVVYETKFVSSNIGDLIKNIEHVSDSGAQEGQPTAKNGRPVTFEVKHFRLQNGHVTLGVGPTSVTLPMPNITLDNLGVNGGISSAELATVIVRSILTSVISSTAHAVGKVGSTMGAAAGDAVDKAGEGIKGLFSGQH
jgi:hypothetical protein